MDLLQRSGVIDGYRGVFVAFDDEGAIWQITLAPDKLSGLLSACARGRTLLLNTEAGVYRALARRWWVLPAGDELQVRIALEQKAAA